MSDVGILNDTASCHTATKLFRELFREFDGRHLNMSCHKSWNTICEYIFQPDRDPYCCGVPEHQCREHMSKLLCRLCQMKAG